MIFVYVDFLRVCVCVCVCVCMYVHVHLVLYHRQHLEKHAPVHTMHVYISSHDTRDRVGYVIQTT